MKLEKGRNSTRIGIRLNNQDILTLQEIAISRKLSFNAYLADRLHTLVEKYRSVPTINGESTGMGNRSVPTTDKQKLLVDLREKIAKIEKKPYNPDTMNLTMQLPAYDPTIHKVGDKVRIQGFGKRWKAIIVPEIDADGHPI